MRTQLIIEQHFHGCFGINFNTATVDEVLYISKEIVKYGVGGIFPTLVTDNIMNIKHQIEIIKEAASKQTPDMAKILGIHLEGIFLNPEKRGIHNPQYFLKPTIENYKLVEDPFIKIQTLAPEFDDGLIKYYNDISEKLNTLINSETVHKKLLEKQSVLLEENKLLIDFKETPSNTLDCAVDAIVLCIEIDKAYVEQIEKIAFYKNGELVKIMTSYLLLRIQLVKTQWLLQKKEKEY